MVSYCWKSSFWLFLLICVMVVEPTIAWLSISLDWCKSKAMICFHWPLSPLMAGNETFNPIPLSSANTPITSSHQTLQRKELHILFWEHPRHLSCLQFLLGGPGISRTNSLSSIESHIRTTHLYQAPHVNKISCGATRKSKYQEYKCFYFSILLPSITIEFYCSYFIILLE